MSDTTHSHTHIHTHTHPVTDVIYSEVFKGTTTHHYFYIPLIMIKYYYNAVARRGCLPSVCVCVCVCVIIRQFRSVSEQQTSEHERVQVHSLTL